MWGKFTSLGCGDVKGERMTEDIGRTFLYSLLTLKFHSFPDKLLFQLIKKYTAQRSGGVSFLSVVRQLSPHPFPF